MGSGLIDVAAMVALASGVLFLALVVTAHTDGALQHVALVICSLIVVFLVYPTTMETLTRGKSLGQAARSGSGSCATTAAP